MKNSDISLQTKKRLSASLKKYMQKKPLSRITINDLILDCDLNRNTFYYHFQDIYALLKWTLEQDAIAVVKSIDVLANMNEAIDFILQYVDENRHIISCVYDSFGANQLHRFFYTDMHAIVTSAIDELEQKRTAPLDSTTKDFLTMFVTEGLAGCLVNYLNDPDHFSREEIKMLMMKLTRSLSYVLEQEL